MTNERTIISVYDYSGNWSLPYREAGYNVIQIDQKIDGTDARLLKKIPNRVRGILAAPPCNKFCRISGFNEYTDEEMTEALSCVDLVFRLVVIYRPVFWALENPPGKLSEYIGRHRYGFQPFWFGDEHTKHTYLWGKFNRPAVQGQFYKSGRKSLVDSVWTSEERAETPLGFARAFFAVNQ